MGELREGTKWYYEACDILLSFFGKGCCYYRGFHNCRFLDGNHTCGVFELDMEVCKVSKEFLEYISNYSSNYIAGISYFNSVGTYNNCVLFIL